MATHSNILAWEIPWTVEPRRQQPMGRKESAMTEHSTCAHTHTHTQGISLPLLSIFLDIGFSLFLSFINNSLRGLCIIYILG